MLKFDFNTYMDRFIDKNKFNELFVKKEETYQKTKKNQLKII